jgi:hypothetical protein
MWVEVTQSVSDMLQAGLTVLISGKDRYFSPRPQRLWTLLSLLSNESHLSGGRAIGALSWPLLFIYSEVFTSTFLIRLQGKVLITRGTFNILITNMRLYQEISCIRHEIWLNKMWSWPFQCNWFQGLEFLEPYLSLHAVGLTRRNNCTSDVKLRLVEMTRRSRGRNCKLTVTTRSDITFHPLYCRERISSFFFSPSLFFSGEYFHVHIFFRFKISN